MIILLMADIYVQYDIYCLYVCLLLPFLQCLMLMEMLFGADGLTQLKGSVVVCAKPSLLQLTRFA